MVDTPLPGSVSLIVSVDGQMQYTIDVGAEAADIVMAISSPYGNASITSSDSEQNSAWSDLVSSIAPYNDVISIVLQEVTASFGSETAGESDSTCASLCREDFPIPDDCQGAWDEYVCCINEAQYDLCRRRCECISLPWYGEVPCTAGAVALYYLDIAACVASLPLS